MMNSEDQNVIPGHLQIAKWSFLILLCASGMTFAGWWNQARLPGPSDISNELYTEPSQIETAVSPFQIDREGHTYEVTPVFGYELQGLVVSQHDSSSWRDISHLKWNDHVNTRDICVIWGTNLKSDHFRKISYSSGDWTCYIQTHSSEAWTQFHKNELSNNHILPANEKVAAALAGVSIGDQIHFKGLLVNYRIDGGPVRATSTTREDSGNGACEIVYVTEFKILRSYNQIWVALLRWGVLLMKLSGLSLFVSLLVWPRFVAEPPEA